MILVRPSIAGDAVLLVGADGMPIPSGHTEKICWDCYGPAVTHEWYYRDTDVASGADKFIVAIEYIWDKAPCKSRPKGVSHSEITAKQLTLQTWSLLVKANPQRYAITISGVVEENAPPQNVIVTR